MSGRRCSNKLELLDGSRITSCSHIYGPNDLERCHSVRVYLFSRCELPTFDGMNSELMLQHTLEYRPGSLRTYFIGTAARVNRLVNRYKPNVDIS
jgi:hypothetical protein